MPGHLAAVDVGTNSIHLVVARVIGDDRFEFVAREKAMVRLGHGGGDMKRLEPAAVERALVVLRRFGQIAAAHEASLRAVATSAVREAENAEILLRRARDEAGVEVEVISGVEEARLIHLGVLQALPVFDQRVLLFDVGGGSTEVLVGLKGEALAARSLKLGAVRLTDRFFAGAHDHPGAVAACRNFVRSALAPVAREVEQHGFDIAVGSSGTVTALAEMAVAASGAPEPRLMNGYVLSRAALGEVVGRVVGAGSVTARRKLPGLDADRADIACAGALIVEQLVSVLGIESITISDYALREGVLLDTLQRYRGGGTLHHLRDVSRRGVAHLASLFDTEPEHSAHVARLAVRLFDETAELHGLGEDAREYLEAGALLANVGLFISHAKHHLHSYYVIRNSEHLTGFTDGEIEVIAQVARYHRKSAPKPSHAEFARLGARDQRVVRTLAGILRIAIAFDRGHHQAVHDVEAAWSSDSSPLTVRAVADPGTDLSLELYAANERRDLLEDVLGRSVRIASR